MVDGVAAARRRVSEGPLPQTRFVLRKALQKRLPVVLVDQQGRPARRPHRRGRRRDLRAVPRPRRRRGPDRLPDRLRLGQGRPGVAEPARGRRDARRRRTSSRCSTRSCATDPGAVVRRRARRCRRTSPTSTPRRTSAGSRCAACTTGTIRKGQQVAWCQHRRHRSSGSRSPSCSMTEALERVPAESAGPGDIIAIAGIPEITIGETLADPDDPRPLPVITVDEPAISMTIGINTSPLAGRERARSSPPGWSRTGSTPSWSATSRSGCCRPSARTPGRCRAAASCSWRSSSRSCAARASSSPSASRRSSPATIDGKLHEPIERLTIDVPEDYLGVVTQLLALRKGRMEQMVNHGTGWVRMEYLVPARGLIGFRTEFLTETRGTGIAAPRLRGLRAVGRRAAHPADRLAGRRPRAAPTTGFALVNLQERGTMFVGPEHRGLRGHDRRRELPRRTTWTSTPPRRRSSPTCASPPATSSCR